MNALADRLGLYRHHGVACNGAAERIPFVMESVEFRIVHPRLLDEFELALDRGVYRDEQYPLFRNLAARG